MIYYKPEQLTAKDYIVVNPSISRPVSLEEVKINSRIDDDSCDAQLLSLIDVATEFGEKITGRDFINKTYKSFLNCFPADSCRSIEIRRTKLQSIVSIKYYLNGILTTFDASKYYITENTDFSRIHLKEGEFWATADRRLQSVVITFIAGYGEDACDVPATIKRAILSHVELLKSESGDCDNANGVNKQAIELYSPFVIITKRFAIA